MSTFQPVPDSASSLTIWLGFCNVNATVGNVGSPAVQGLTLDPAEWGIPITLNANDVGDIVAIFVNQGSPSIYTALWTTITAVLNTTQCLLADSTVGMTGAQAIVFRRFTENINPSGGPNYILQDSIEFEASITVRPTLNFTTYSPTFDTEAALIPVVGQPVLMTDSDGTIGTAFGPVDGDIFGGSIEQAKVTNYPGTGIVQVECQCISWDAVLNHRILGLTSAFPTSNITVDFNGAQENTSYSSPIFVNPFRFFELGQTAVAIISVALNGIPQTVGDGSLYPVQGGGGIPGHPGGGGYQWYGGGTGGTFNGQSVLYEDPSGPALGSGDSIVIVFQTVAPPEPSITYATLNQTADQIILQLLAFIQNQEGITISNVVTGPIIGSITFQANQTFDEAFASITSYINDGTTNYWYYLDVRKGFHFEVLGITAVAPWNISVLDGSDANVQSLVSQLTTREKYANAAWINSSELLAAVTEVLQGDGSSLSHNVTYPVGDIVSIFFCAGLNSTNIPRSLPAPYVFGSTQYPEAQTVGTPLTATGFDWLWQIGSTEILEDNGNPAISNTEAIYVTYNPQISQIQPFPASSSIPDSAMLARQKIEGGSGEYDTTIDLSSDLPFVQGAPAQSASQATAQLIAQYFQNLAQVAEVDSYRSGLAPGQSIIVDLF